MKPAPFRYVRPASVEEALDELDRGGELARPLAGGQSLLPLLNMRLASPAILVDISRLESLRRAELAPNSIRIGAGCTMSRLELDPGLEGANPLLAAALPHIGHFQIRNRATVCGSLAHLDPAAELPALALLLEARLEVRSRSSSRRLAMSEFGLGSMESALEPGELVTEVQFPWSAGARWGFAEVARRPGDFALVGAAAFLPPQAEPRLVVFGAGPMAQMLPRAAAAAATGDLAAVEAAARDEIEAWGDIHAGADYRRVVGARIVRRVVGQAIGPEPVVASLPA
ncbi:MAG TPA: FAD binding domain-containing protein [Candidatus Nitrosotalea sp.]|nr:FAD binding domain-containing protein [Candidatus Nitrosotalea sp.]